MTTLCRIKYQTSLGKIPFIIKGISEFYSEFGYFCTHLIKWLVNNYSKFLWIFFIDVIIKSIWKNLENSWGWVIQFSMTWWQINLSENKYNL